MDLFYIFLLMAISCFFPHMTNLSPQFLFYYNKFRFYFELLMNNLFEGNELSFLESYLKSFAVQTIRGCVRD